MHNPTLLLKAMLSQRKGPENEHEFLGELGSTKYSKTSNVRSHTRVEKTHSNVGGSKVENRVILLDTEACYPLRQLTRGTSHSRTTVSERSLSSVLLYHTARACKQGFS